MSSDFVEYGRGFKEASCQGKEKFTTWERANSVATRKKRAAKYGVISVYKCSLCEGYHYGKRVKRKKDD